MYESPFPADDVYPIAELPTQYGLLADHINQIPGLQMPARSHPANLGFSYSSSLTAPVELLPPPAIAPFLCPITALLVAIWETAPPNETRIRPFHFVAKYLVSSQQGMFDLLKQYHTAYLDSPAPQGSGGGPHFFIGVPSLIMQMAASL